jgi:hypothetical protein
MRWLGLALSACVACGDAAFVCAQDADCTAGQAGVCQSNGYCSFPDDGCTSGQRYADHSGALSSLCVDPEVGTSSASSEVTTGDATVASLTSVPPESSDSVASSDDSADTTSAVSAGTTTTTMPTSEGSTSAATDSSSTGEPVDPDLLLWLRFEDGSELVNDGVVGGVATCEGGCPLQEDAVATFDGTDDCLVAPLDDAFSADAFTAAAWLWRNDEVDDFYFYVFGKSFGDVGDNSWELFVIPDDMLVPVLRAHIDAPSTSSSTWRCPRHSSGSTSRRRGTAWRCDCGSTAKWSVRRMRPP